MLIFASRLVFQLHCHHISVPPGKIPNAFVFCRPVNSAIGHVSSKHIIEVIACVCEDG